MHMVDHNEINSKIYAAIILISNQCLWSNQVFKKNFNVESDDSHMRKHPFSLLCQQREKMLQVPFPSLYIVCKL